MGGCVRLKAIIHAGGWFLHARLGLVDGTARHRYSEDELHGTSGASITGDLIGYTTGLLITLVLLVLTLRAAKLPGTPIANIIFAVCGLLWSAGGLARAASLGSGMAELRGVASAALSLQYTGAAAFPIAILAIWRRYAIQDWQRRAARILNIIAIASAAAIAFSCWLHLFPLGTLAALTACNAGVLLVAGIPVIMAVPCPVCHFAPEPCPGLLLLDPVQIRPRPHIKRLPRNRR